MLEPRYCSNCRAELPAKAEACPACGVFAGELYDKRMHRPKTRFALFGALLLLVLAAGGAAVWWNARRALPETARRPQEVPRTRVVADRPGGAKRAPGAKINAAEAMRLARQYLVMMNGLKSECVVLLGNGTSGGGYLITARDRCASTSLGKWRVDAETGHVTRAR